MKLLGVTPLYPPRSLVGAWIATHELLRHMVVRGHDVEVVQYLASAPPYDLDGVKVGPRRKVMATLAHDADVVLSHMGDSGIGHRSALRRGVPSVRIAHGGNIDRASTRGAALAIFNSEASMAALGWVGPQMVVHPPVDPADYRTTPGGCVTLVNLSEAKGGRVFWSLARRLPHVQFIGVRGQYGRQLDGELANVTVLEPQQDMRSVYARTRLLLMPSAVETWGRVGVEAMASGIPVVAHPTEGLKESLGSAGVFVDRTDLDGWARWVERLLTRPSTWEAASRLAQRRSAQLHPAADLERFALAVEALATRGAAACVS